jgi:hypothetical protein
MPQPDPVPNARCLADAVSPERLGMRGSWSGADGPEPRALLGQAVPGDLTITDQGEVWLAAVQRAADGSTTLCLGRNAGRWEFEELARGVGFHPPVLHVLPDGCAHLAWSDTRGRVLYLRYRRGTRAEPRILARGDGENGRDPAIISNGQQFLIAYETLYDEIEYAVEEGGKWRTTQRLSRADRRFAADVLHSPQLALDRHGLVWLFFSDATRRFTYFARWLGAGWSDVYDCRGIYYRAPRFETNLLGAGWLGVEKHPPPRAADLGITLANSLAATKTEFHRIPVPALAAAPGTSAIFFDLQEAAGLDGLDLALDEARSVHTNSSSTDFQGARAPWPASWRSSTPGSSSRLELRPPQLRQPLVGRNVRINRVGQEQIRGVVLEPAPQEAHVTDEDVLVAPSPPGLPDLLPAFLRAGLGDEVGEVEPADLLAVYRFQHLGPHGG